MKNKKEKNPGRYIKEDLNSIDDKLVYVGNNSYLSRSSVDEIERKKKENSIIIKKRVEIGRKLKPSDIIFIIEDYQRWFLSNPKNGDVHFYRFMIERYARKISKTLIYQ